jgi:hypothetical protein
MQHSQYNNNSKRHSQSITLKASLSKHHSQSTTLSQKTIDYQSSQQLFFSTRTTKTQICPTFFIDMASGSLMYFFRGNIIVLTTVTNWK